MNRKWALPLPFSQGLLCGFPIRGEMTQPDSTNAIYIETFSMIGKQMERF